MYSNAYATLKECWRILLKTESKNFYLFMSSGVGHGHDVHVFGSLETSRRQLLQKVRVKLNSCG